MKKPDDKLQQLVTRLQQACGKNLVSVVLYGSAAREDFHEQFSDVNLLVVLERMDEAAFTGITPVLQWWSREEKLRPPLVMTNLELRQSADVFAIELYDIKRTHRTLYGEDVVSAIAVPMNLHRVEVEHELRTTLLRLRQHLLLTPDNDPELSAVLAKSVTSVLTLVRHALIALGEAPPEAKAKLLEHGGEVFGYDVMPLRMVLEMRETGHRPDDLRGLYVGYMNAIGRVAHELDARAPKQQWHKHD